MLAGMTSFGMAGLTECVSPRGLRWYPYASASAGAARWANLTIFLYCCYEWGGLVVQLNSVCQQPEIILSQKNPHTGFLGAALIAVRCIGHRSHVVQIKLYDGFSFFFSISTNSHTVTK